MQVYKTKAKRLPGSDIREVRKSAFLVFQKILKKSKRRSYIRSAYFNKEKVFLNLFWEHLFTKENWRDRVRRLKYLPPAFELIQKTRFHPISKENPNKQDEIFHRFAGMTSENHLFYVQIKENKRKGQKWLISFFPENG